MRLIIQETMKKKSTAIHGLLHRRSAVAVMGGIFAAALLGGCSLETSDNGDLDGFWHLERVDTLATGGTYDCSGQRVFWGVELRLINVSNKDRDGRGFYFRFEQTGDSLFLGKAYKNNWHQDNGDDGGDVPVDDVEPLRPYGINRLEEHFAKEALSASKMVLRSRELRLSFTRF